MRLFYRHGIIVIYYRGVCVGTRNQTQMSGCQLTVATLEQTRAEQLERR
jgi:hypothetical protein